jgi:hypothetical protein
MAGLFDNLFGAPGGMYADMLSPEQQAQIRRQSMMQMAAKLLEGSGPFSPGKPMPCSRCF